MSWYPRHITDPIITYINSYQNAGGELPPAFLDQLIKQIENIENNYQKIIKKQKEDINIFNIIEKLKLDINN